MRQATYVDFGGTRGVPPGILVDKDGNKIVFDGKIDALNKMTRLGWKLVSTYAVSGKDDEGTYCYMLMSKEVEDGEPIERYVGKKEFQRPNE